METLIDYPKLIEYYYLGNLRTLIEYLKRKEDEE